MIRSSFRITALTVFLLSTSQLFGGGGNLRTWVAAAGDDANSGSRTAPCKTYAGAIAKTVPGGEINAMDPGSYGEVTITKSMTIDGQGTMASILASGTSGIIVNAAATDTVTIRNLSITGAGFGLNGIRFIAGGTLILENVRIMGVIQYGVDVSQSADSRLIMRNVSISGCTLAGISASTTSGNAYLDLEDVRVSACGIGVNGTNGARATLKRCNLAMCATGLVIKSSSISSRALLDGCIITNNTNAVTAGPGTSLCRMSDCTISNNLVGITSNSGATLSSAGNNRIIGNGTDGPIPPVFTLR